MPRSSTTRGFRLMSASFAAATLAFAAWCAPERLAPAPDAESLLFFDGVCNLCNGFVNFVAEHDSMRRIKFGAIQKHVDRLHFYGAGRYAPGGEEALSTLVLVQDGRVHVRSDAALRIAALLDAPAKYLAVFHFLPAFLRDAGYKLVASNRYRVFGQTETCREPSPLFQSKFIEFNGEPPAPWETPG